MNGNPEMTAKNGASRHELWSVANIGIPRVYAKPL